MKSKKISEIILLLQKLEGNELVAHTTKNNKHDLKKLRIKGYH